MTRICPECQTENDDNREFCRECGVNLVDVASSESDDASENKWALKLFYWKDEKTNKYRIKKKKIISEIVFLLWIIYFTIFYLFMSNVKYGVFPVVAATLVLSFVLTLPVLAVGFLIHKFLN